jgi:hypothetical protein
VDWEKEGEVGLEGEEPLTEWKSKAEEEKVIWPLQYQRKEEQTLSAEFRL